MRPGASPSIAPRLRHAVQALAWPATPPIYSGSKLLLPLPTGATDDPAAATEDGGQDGEVAAATRRCLEAVCKALAEAEGELNALDAKVTIWHQLFGGWGAGPQRADQLHSRCGGMWRVRRRLQGDVLDWSSCKLKTHPPHPCHSALGGGRRLRQHAGQGGGRRAAAAGCAAARRPRGGGGGAGTAGWPQPGWYQRRGGAWGPREAGSWHGMAWEPPARRPPAAYAVLWGFRFLLPLAASPVWPPPLLAPSTCPAVCPQYKILLTGTGASLAEQRRQTDGAAPTLADLAAALSDGAAAVGKYGGAQLGSRTMLDAVVPAAKVGWGGTCSAVVGAGMASSSGTMHARCVCVPACRVPAASPTPPVPGRSGAGPSVSCVE